MKTWTVRTRHEDPNDDAIYEGVVGLVATEGGLLLYTQEAPGIAPETTTIPDAGMLAFDVELAHDLSTGDWGARV